jgi:hypothetical protein
MGSLQPWHLLALVVVLAPLVWVGVRVRRRSKATMAQVHKASEGGPNPTARQPQSATLSTQDEDRRSAGANAPSGVFISYRRDDESNFAGRLFERLLRNLDAKRVFMDVDSIELGLDFTEVIDTWLEQCSVMLVVIGNKWLDCAGPDGRRRLDDPDDFVRIEVESALARPGVRVIPILVDGASVPGAADLPDHLKPLARRNALTMSHAGFGSDFERLFSTLDRVI